MPHSSLYLTKLYNDLITNTPQTITMDIPSEVGHGRISQTKIKHGVVLSDWQMCYQSDMNVQGPVSREYMQIIFCMNDGIFLGYFEWASLYDHSKKSSPAFMPDMMVQNIFVTKMDSNFSFKSIKIPTPYFSQLLADYFDGQEIAAVDVQTKYEFVTLNVREFGAYGDGVHDDTNAIQCAIMACPEGIPALLVPEGVYKISSIFLKDI